MFKITDGKGFHITFQNGYTISVQFGPGNYCENRNLSLAEFAKRNPDIDLQSATAEVAIFDNNGKWATKRAAAELFDDTLDEDVVGWVTPDGVSQMIEWTRKASPALDNRSAEEKLRELAKYIREHPQAAQGMGDKPHAEWIKLQQMAREVLSGT